MAAEIKRKLNAQSCERNLLPAPPASQPAKTLSGFLFSFDSAPLARPRHLYQFDSFALRLVIHLGDSSHCRASAPELRPRPMSWPWEQVFFLCATPINYEGSLSLIAVVVFLVVCCTWSSKALARAAAVHSPMLASPFD